jgi:hypothetical protein
MSHQRQLHLVVLLLVLAVAAAAAAAAPPAAAAEMWEQLVEMCRRRAELTRTEPKQKRR